MIFNIIVSGYSVLNYVSYANLWEISSLYFCQGKISDLVDEQAL
jgi:hypothetical protein